MTEKSVNKKKNINIKNIKSIDILSNLEAKFSILQIGILDHKQPFHLVEPSPWPFYISFGWLGLTTGAVAMFHGIFIGSKVTICAFLIVISSMIFWFKDVITESTHQGFHTELVQKGISTGFALFIASEVFFFLSIFWAFFHSSIAPAIELGSNWPPKGIIPLNTWELPMLNTIILLSSGATITFGHHSTVDNNFIGSNEGSLFTIILAILFTLFQGFEYDNASYTFTDSVFGSCFFMGTGFHGLHVIIGTIFLTVAAIRVLRYNFTNTHHVGLEAGILYWHFVDIVWLFLFISVYFWGGQFYS